MNVYHQMKEAPTTGYRRELILEPESFARAADHIAVGQDNLVYIFFKAKGKYGKGHIGKVSVQEDGTVVLVGAQFRLQPDGSRNLETDEGPLPYFPPTAPSDTTPPTITILGNNPAAVPCGAAYADAGATASDGNDVNLTSTIITNNAVNTASAGQQTVSYTVRDAAGNQTTASRMVKVLYQFTGFLPPISGADAAGGTVAKPVETSKAGSKIPVKFTISCAGKAANTGAHTLQVIQLSNQTTAAAPIDASPADAATQDNQFRWAGDQWQYVLDTRATGMIVGIWELRATLSDGSQHSAFIALK